MKLLDLDRWLVALPRSDGTLYLCSAHRTREDAAGALTDLHRWEHWREARIFDSRKIEIELRVPSDLSHMTPEGILSAAHACDWSPLRDAAQAVLARGAS